MVPWVVVSSTGNGKNISHIAEKLLQHDLVIDGQAGVSSGVPDRAAACSHSIS